MVKNTVVVVTGAGVEEVNGEYHFMEIKNNAGFYERQAPFNGSPTNSRFTLYKCHLKSGGFQWFISITPEGIEPGTSQDVDFYYAVAKAIERLPPQIWHIMNTQFTRDPPPRVECIRDDHTGGAAVPGVVTSESSSDNELDKDDLEDGDECSSMVAGDDEIIETSFMSTNTDIRDFYD